MCHDANEKQINKKPTTTQTQQTQTKELYSIIPAVTKTHI